MNPSDSGHLPINGLSLYYEVYGESYRKEGHYPTVTANIERLTPAVFAGSSIETAFKEHTPNDAAFDAYIEKMKAAAANDQGITDDQMRALSAPTMVIIGDADAVTPEHALTMFKLRGGGEEEAGGSGVLQGIPGARLAVLPATSHLGLLEQSALVAPIVAAFLDDVPPAT